jgi:hypothetical protein
VGAEVMVVAAYGLILPQVVLDMPRFGCLNIHASLLPRWRGAAPIQRALLAGDAASGVCIMQMEAGLDTGPVLAAGGFPDCADDTSVTLHDRLAGLGAQLIVEALGKLPLAGRAATAEGVTYAHKIEKAEALIDWTKAPLSWTAIIALSILFPVPRRCLPARLSSCGGRRRLRQAVKLGRFWRLTAALSWWPAVKARWRSANCKRPAASVCRCSSFWPVTRSRWATVSICRPEFSAA